MSTGNQGHQNYDKQRSQRVGLKGYIGWGFSFCLLFMECVQPRIITDIFIVLNKKRIVVNLPGGDLDICTVITIFIYF